MAPVTLLFSITSIEQHPAHGEVGRGVLSVVGTGLSVDAISGPWGNGVLPAGNYELKHSGFTDRPLQPPLKSSYCDPRGNCWFQYIKPLFNTTRNNLGIHPDGHTAGTAGCIGLLIDDSKAWRTLFEQNTSDKLLKVSHDV